MFDEMSFLFESSKAISNQFNTTSDASRENLNGITQVRNSNNGTQSLKEKIEYDDDSKSWKFNKYVVNKTSINNHLLSNVNKSYKSSGKNPYISLLEDFNGEGTNAKSLKIKASDLSYLRDIGVFPINRLMILRRFPEGALVPVDLNDLDVEPISTIIGWVKSEDDLLNFNVNEVWETQEKWLHELINDIISSEFGINLNELVPIPGWGEGFMFGLLRKMGLTDYSATNIPFGDPNLLQEGITRKYKGQGLMSSFNFVLETVYEQKYIGGIDAGAAANDIIENAMTMGTSNIRYMGKPGNKLSKALRDANNNPSNPDGWKNLIISTVSTVVSALSGVISNTIDSFSTDDSESSDPETEQKKKSKEAETMEANVQKLGIVQTLISSVLASTIARYQWPIRGALNQLTGEAATPWHLTIGNPNAPLLSMNNIKVSTLDVTLGNEMAYNDMPKYTTIKATIEQGRNLGKQEIESMFGVVYKREYKKI